MTKILETKLGRFGQPEDIAGATFPLASEDASFVTGQAIADDGGWVTTMVWWS